MAWNFGMDRARKAIERSGTTSVCEDAIAAQLPRDVRARLHVGVRYNPVDDVMEAVFAEVPVFTRVPYRSPRVWSCVLEQRHSTRVLFRTLYVIPDAFLALLCLEV